MPMVSNWARIVFPPALLVIVTTSACIFNFDDFIRPQSDAGDEGSSGTQGGMGGEPANASNASTGTGGSGNSGAGGNGGAGAGGPSDCSMPVNVPMGVLYEKNPSNPCYIIFYGIGATWKDAAKQCQMYWPGANLAMISGKSEHDEIKKWLEMLSNKYDAWIGGRRIQGDKNPDNANSFGWYRWDVAKNDVVDANSWLIYPCDPAVKGCDDDREYYWGKYDNGAQQPGGYVRCVQYATSSIWNPKGLDDDFCDLPKPYICEVSK